VRLNRAGKPQDEQPFHREIEQHESGWWLPAQVGGSFAKWRDSAAEHVNAACRHVRKFDLAVQAGCHVGIWASLLADKFLEVRTFEPDEVNRRCAEKNLRELPNVWLHDCGLGDRQWTAPWYRSLSNTGKHKLAMRGKVDGMVPVITLDSLELRACDLLALDIEGYEEAALRGAEATIEAHRPVILTEDLPHAPWYGLKVDGVRRWMAEHGYRQAERIDDDVIWVSER
jgi:FkbM family methyltransferase